MAAASIGETGACLIRVPTENVKQNLQAGRYQTQGEAVRTIMGKEGVMGFYKGFLSTVFREVRNEGGRKGAINRNAVSLFIYRLLLISIAAFSPLANGFISHTPSLPPSLRSPSPSSNSPSTKRPRRLVTRTREASLSLPFQAAACLLSHTYTHTLPPSLPHSLPPSDPLLLYPIPHLRSGQNCVVTRTRPHRLSFPSSSVWFFCGSDRRCSYDAVGRY